MNTRWKVLGLGAACAAALGAALMLRHPSTPPAPPIPPPVEVVGFAEFPQPLGPFDGGTLSIRLLDLASRDSSTLLIASSTLNVPPRSTSQAWSLRVPRDRARFAEDAYVVFSYSDQKGVRFIGSGFPRELTHLPRGAPPSYRAKWLGILMTAVPAS